MISYKEIFKNDYSQLSLKACMLADFDMVRQLIAEEHLINPDACLKEILPNPDGFDSKIRTIDQNFIQRRNAIIRMLISKGACSQNLVKYAIYTNDMDFIRF